MQNTRQQWNRIDFSEAEVKMILLKAAEEKLSIFFPDPHRVECKLFGVGTAFLVGYMGDLESDE